METAPPTPKDPWPADDDLPEPPEQADEVLHVFYRRYREARAAGLSFVEARLFADSDADIGWLRKLVRDECSPELIASIVL
jgi:hypothetical protein